HFAGKRMQPPKLLLLEIVFPLAADRPKLDCEAGGIMGARAADALGQCHRRHHSLVPRRPSGAVEPDPASCHCPPPQYLELCPEQQQLGFVRLALGNQRQQCTGEHGTSIEKHETLTASMETVIL